MKKIGYKWLLLIILVAITAVSCSSERRASGRSCGCGVHKGYV